MMIDIKMIRKSDEQIEIVAYLLKHRPVDTKNKQEVVQTVSWLREEIKKRQHIQRCYGAKKTNNDYIYVLEQYERLTELMG